MLGQAQVSTDSGFSTSGRRRKSSLRLVVQLRAGGTNVSRASNPRSATA
jgi:hypothetical protein